MRVLLFTSAFILFGLSSFGQFNDTLSLNTYIRENVKDKRPEKVTALQIQTGMLGISNLMLTRSAGDLRYKPIGYVPAWSEVTGKPTIFPPSLHTHDASEIVSGTVAIERLPLTFPYANGILDGNRVLTGKNNAYRLTLDSLSQFIVNTKGATGTGFRMSQQSAVFSIMNDAGAGMSANTGGFFIGTGITGGATQSSIGSNGGDMSLTGTTIVRVNTPIYSLLANEAKIGTNWGRIQLLAYTNNATLDSVLYTDIDGYLRQRISVTSVAGRTGAVVLDTGDFSNFTQKVRNTISAGGMIIYSPATGSISHAAGLGYNLVWGPATGAKVIGKLSINTTGHITDWGERDLTPADIGAVPGTAGSFIQNGTTVQPTSNFNISGNGIIGGTLTTGGANSGATAGTNLLTLYNDFGTAIANKRWAVNLNAASGPGGISGNDFQISSYNTSGTLISTPFSIERSSGAVYMPYGFVSSGASHKIAGGQLDFTSTDMLTFYGSIGRELNSDNNLRIVSNDSISFSNSLSGTPLMLISPSATEITPPLKLSTITNEATDVDRFLVSNNGIVKYRTGVQLLSDIGGQPAGAYLTANQAITLSGDITGTGSTAIATTLKNTGTAGTYTKVTTDAQGRVTTGASLTATDIPVLDWAKITTGKPITLAGYGITDAQPAGSYAPATGSTAYIQNGTGLQASSNFNISGTGAIGVLKLSGIPLVKEGTNAPMGLASFASGTTSVVVSNTNITANTRVQLSIQSYGGSTTTISTPYISARTAGTSFTITWSKGIGTDTGTVSWVLIEPY